MKRNLYLFIVVGVIIAGLALVSAGLAQDNHTRQALSSTQLSPALDTAPASNLAGRAPVTSQYTPTNLTGSQPVNHTYQPYVQRPPSRDWQALENGFLRTSSESALPESVESNFGEWDSSGVYAPSIARIEDTLWMWYTGIAWDNSYALGLATSEDGISWDKAYTTPVLNQAAEAGFLALAPDDYRLYFSNWDDGNIYLSESSDGGYTWSAPGAPVFSPTHDPADWDVDFVSDPVVLYVGGTYYMFYEGGGGDPFFVGIGLAMSPDGINWTRVGGDPILTNGDPGAWDEQWVLDPMVIEDGGDWQMWFRGRNYNNESAIGYATSDDGLVWEKYTGNPVLSANPSGWDTGGPTGPWVDYHEDMYYMWYCANRQIGYATSEDGINWERPLDDAVLKPSPLLYLELNYAHDWAHVYTVPNEAVTVTLEDSENNILGTISGYANDWGDFWSGDWLWDPSWQDIQPYQSIFIDAAGLSEAVDPIGEMLGQLDLDTDLVTGLLNAPWLGDEVQMYCELWAEPGGSIDLGLVSGNGGTFECDFGGLGIDLQPGMQVALVYIEPDGDRVINVVEPPWMRVNYAHDWVGGNYPAGHTFNITVKDSTGAIKATTVIDSETGKGWSGDGFETRWEDWSPTGLDIVPGDRVLFESDDGFVDIMHVGEVGGTLDIAADLISGPVYADWYTEELYIECHPWGAPPGISGRNSTAGPDGDPPYTCDWSGEWDILPGQDVAVMYIQPDNGDRVINVFHEPAPNLAINKWVEGSGLVAPGGPVIFNIAYGNNGEAVAESLTITDTLPDDTTYVSDTSGETAITGPGWVAWNLGPLNPGEWKHFYVVLENSAQVDDILRNNAEIFTEFDFDDSNDHAYAEAQVTAGGYDIWVNKNPNPGDPTPGETFLYQINVGNNNDTASGPVTLTETLPAGTNLVSWYSQSGFQLWEQASYDNGELVLTAPSFAGYWGDTLRLTLEVDPAVEYGTQLTNTVEVTTTDDLDPSNNWSQNTDAWVSPPRIDGRVYKSIPWGQIYPGGELVYPISFFNDGNTTFEAVLTDTLPAGMSFASVTAWLHGAEFSFEPEYVDEAIIVWNYAALPPGEWIDMDVRLAIDPSYDPGTAAINCITLDVGGDDALPLNNQSCVEYVVPEAGPNLRLTKNYWWNGEGQLQYQLEIQNIGSTVLDNIDISDTLPELTTSNGNWWVNFGPWITGTVDVGADQVFFWVDYLNPRDIASLSYQADLDADVVGDLGLTFTNMAEAPVTGDVNPADNTASVTAFTGPDIFIDKWLGGGKLEPGEIITYTVEFGNLNKWPWVGDTSVGSHITDTLPAGATFLYATAPWNINDTWEPESIEGNVIRWGWGPMWPESTWRFDIVVQLADDLEENSVLTNTIEAYSDDPEAFDFFWENNFDEVTFMIDMYPFEYFLPMNFKH